MVKRSSSKLIDAQIRKRLASVLVERFSCDESSFEGAFQLVRKAIIKRDPPLNAIQFKIVEDETVTGKGIKLDLKNIPGDKLLEFLTYLGNKELEIHEGVVYFLPHGESLEPFLTRWVSMPSVFLPKLEDLSKNEEGLYNVKQILIEKGLKFPRDASAFYDDKTGLLTITNTLEQLKLLESTHDVEEKSSTLEEANKILDGLFDKKTRADLKEGRMNDLELQSGVLVPIQIRFVHNIGSPLSRKLFAKGVTNPNDIGSVILASYINHLEGRKFNEDIFVEKLLESRKSISSKQ